MAAQPTPPSDLRDDLRDDLAAWLDGFHPSDRSKGRAYHADGRVRALHVAQDPSSTVVTVAVRGTRSYACHLTHAPDSGWAGDCSCPVSQECKHLYAAGLALDAHLATSAPFAPRSPAPGAPNRAPAASDHESTLVTHFTAATGAPPIGKALTYLRHLVTLHRSLQPDRYYDNRTFAELLPATHRPAYSYAYQNPFADRWSGPPATPLEFWSHLALLFEEKSIPAPAFMAKLTDLPWARAAVNAHRLQRELALWRGRFALLEADAAENPSTSAPPLALHALRLRLSRPKTAWEISTTGSDQPSFHSLSSTALRDLLHASQHTAFSFEPASASLAAILIAHLAGSGRTAVKLTDAADRSFLGRLLSHPLASACVVAADGTPITRDPRRLVWSFTDHPNDPALCLARLAFADGTLAPGPLLHLAASPALYLHGATLFTGLPPLADDGELTFALPRAALALPEAGRFAARAGLTLPGDIAGRFRHETLRPRLRAQLSPRYPQIPPGEDDIILLELTAIAPDGTPRGHYHGDTWHRSGHGLPPPPPDSAFLILDFVPTRTALAHFFLLPTFRNDHYPAGPRLIAEINSPSFPETFSTWLAGFPANTLIELAPELAAFAAAPTRAHFAIDLTPGDETGIDWFDVRVTLRAEDTALTPAEIALLHSARGRFVRLAGRGWRRLIVDNSPATQEKIARLGLDPATAAAETGREPLRFHALQLADETLRDALPEKLWAQVRDRSAALRASPAPTLPAGLVADLRPYQHEGFHFLSFLSENNFGGILADDMGLGKTLQTLAWLLALAARPRLGKKPFRVLVVCPKSVVVNWQLETARFAPALTTAAFTSALVVPSTSGSPSASGSKLSALRSQLLITNYTQLRLNADALASQSWDAVILDEGQNIKNPASSTAAAARALRTAHRLVLTGTPVENRLLDLWSLFAFAQPGLLGGQTAFKRLYNDKADPAARTRLAARVKHFLLRRTKSQVARDLPARIEEELVVELEGPQRALYDAELKRTRALLLGVKSARQFDTQRFNILQSLLRLRQICCDPRLVGAGELPKNVRGKSAAKKSRAAKITVGSAASGSQLSDSKAEIDASTPDSLPLPSAKLEALLDTVEPLAAEGHKVLIFSQFVTMLELIRVELTARGIPHLLLTGQTENRQALVDKFQTDATIPVFLLSLKAAGSGLNLTAASYVVLFDPWWNPAVEAQAIDRTHRIGQKNQVIAYRLIARDTIEQKIRALQKEKAALAAAVVQEESLATVLDLESLRQILA